MNILFAFTGTYPNGMAMTNRLHCYARGITENNINVHIVTPRSKTNSSESRFNFQSTFDGISYEIIFNRMGRGIWNYVLKEIEPYILALYCIAHIRKYEVFGLIDLGVLPNLLLIPVLHLFGRKVVFELNENPYATEGSRLTRIKPINGIFRWTMLHLIFPQVDGFVVISQNLKNLVSQYNKNGNIIKIPILINEKDYSEWNHADKRNTYRPYLFHAGSLSVKKDGIVKVFEAYIKACLELNSMDLDFVITNRSTRPEVWEQINQMLHDNKLEQNLIITGYLSDSELRTYLQEAFVTVINKPVNEQNKYNFPTKLGDYMLSETPMIIAADGVELLEYIKNDLNAVVVLPDNVEEMKNAIIKIFNNREYAKHLATNSKATALDNFSYKIHGKILSLFINSLIA